MQGPLSMKLECISEIFNAHGDFFLLNSNCNLAIPFSAITAIPYSTTLLMLNKDKVIMPSNYHMLLQTTFDTSAYLISNLFSLDNTVERVKKPQHTRFHS